MNDRLNFEAESFAVQPEFEGEFQEFAAEQTEAEWAGESGRMRRLPSRAGQPAPRFSRSTGRFAGRPSRTRPVQPSRPTLWRPRPRPYPWPPRAVVRDPYSIVREPYSVEPGATVVPGSEYIRWVQDCLNRTFGLQLPLTGVLGRETRSAIRSFQKQQGLPVSGIVGPETEAALRSICSRTYEPGSARSSNARDSEISTDFSDSDMEEETSRIDKNKHCIIEVTVEKDDLDITNAEHLTGAGVYVFKDPSKPNPLYIGKTGMKEGFSKRYAIFYHLVKNMNWDHSIFPKRKIEWHRLKEYKGDGFLSFSNPSLIAVGIYELFLAVERSPEKNTYSNLDIVSISSGGTLTIVRDEKEIYKIAGRTDNTTTLREALLQALDTFNIY